MYKRVSLSFINIKKAALAAFVCVAGFPACMTASAENTEPQQYCGQRVTEEGAWCWFADPRAMHYESKDGKINMSHLGYIGGLHKRHAGPED